MEDSVKLVIMSDNHFQKNEVQGIVSRHHEDTDYFIHCGDSQWNVDDPFFKDMIVVKGNNDFQKFPEQVVFEAGGKTIFVTHGHVQYVYWDGEDDNTKGTDELVSYAIGLHADIVFYGHTHVPEMHMDRDVFVLNPGSTNFPRNYQKRIRTYAVVTIKNGEIDAQFYDVITHENITASI